MPVSTRVLDAPATHDESSLLEMLPLTVMEEFLLDQDAAEHPMIIHVEMRFAGACRRDILSRTYREAVQRHPLLCSTIEDVDGCRVWKRLPDVPELEWVTAAPSKIPEPIDISRRAGLRTRVIESDGELTVLLDFHHACCDGQGGRQFVSDWFAAYRAAAEGLDGKLTTLIPARLGERHVYSQIGPGVGFWEGMRNLLNTICGRTARIASGARHAELNTRLEQRVLDAAQTQQVRESLQASRLTMNDVGLAASLLAFRDVFPHESRRRYVTVMNPVDLRRASDLRLPACNRVGFVFIRRRLPASLPVADLLRSIDGELNYIKQRRVGEEFEKGIAAVRGIPGALRKIRDWGWFTPTLLFTCLGDTTRMFRHRHPADRGEIVVGGLRLLSISGYPPVGEGVPLGLAACETHNRLSLTVHANSRTLTGEQVREFADAFARQFVLCATSVSAAAEANESPQAGHAAIAVGDRP